jgi:hypothetical protein
MYSRLITYEPEKLIFQESTNYYNNKITMDSSSKNIKIGLFKKISIDQILNIDCDASMCTIRYLENDDTHYKTYSHCQKKKYNMCKQLKKKTRPGSSTILNKQQN